MYPKETLPQCCVIRTFIEKRRLATAGLRPEGAVTLKIMETNTFSNGCLGSHIDEERSEMRYVMRIAKPVSHQNFERTLHFPLGSMSVGVSVHPHPGTTFSF